MKAHRGERHHGGAHGDRDPGSALRGVGLRAPIRLPTPRAAPCATHERQHECERGMFQRDGYERRRSATAPSCAAISAAPPRTPKSRARSCIGDPGEAEPDHPRRCGEVEASATTAPRVLLQPNARVQRATKPEARAQARQGGGDARAHQPSAGTPSGEDQYPVQQQACAALAAIITNNAGCICSRPFRYCRSAM